MELAIVARRALASLRAQGLRVERAWQGALLTALEMPGCSLSVMKLDSERLDLLDAPGSAPAWPGSGRIGSSRRVVAVLPSTSGPARPAGPHSRRLQEMARAIATALQRAEPVLTDLDTRAGDGDLGLGMTRGAEAIHALDLAAFADPPTALLSIGEALRRAIGGSSGPFYAVALARAARELPAEPQVADWSRALRAGAEAIAVLGGARAGDCTMLDAMMPAVDAFGGEPDSAAQALAAAAAAAEAGAAATAAMRPRLGRASYLGERAIGVADGGATAVAIWLRALALAFTSGSPSQTL
jgi:dihydroxyacetone kinase